MMGLEMCFKCRLLVRPRHLFECSHCQTSMCRTHLIEHNKEVTFNVLHVPQLVKGAK